VELDTLNQWFSRIILRWSHSGFKQCFDMVFPEYKRPFSHWMCWKCRYRHWTQV